MEFKEGEAIYLQIADIVCEGVLAGTWSPGDRIPSVRELAETSEVNPNTVMRTFSYLEAQGIITNQRGIGYFLSDRAREITAELMRTRFVRRDLPRVFRTMDLLGMGFEELKALYQQRAGAASKEATS